MVVYMNIMDSRNAFASPFPCSVNGIVESVLLKLFLVASFLLFRFLMIMYNMEASALAPRMLKTTINRISPAWFHAANSAALAAAAELLALEMDDEVTDAVLVVVDIDDVLVVVIRVDETVVEAVEEDEMVDVSAVPVVAVDELSVDADDTVVAVVADVVIDPVVSVAVVIVVVVDDDSVLVAAVVVSDVVVVVLVEDATSFS